MDKSTILEVNDLSIYYYLPQQVKKAVDKINFQVYKDEVFGLVGESGSGKSTLCFGLMRMPPPPGKIASGEIRFDGEDLLSLSEEQLRRLRWSKLAYIPQGAMSSFNPVTSLLDQFLDVIIDHEGRQPRSAMIERVHHALAQVDLPPQVAKKYPHQLSGGMKQRACIALAVLLKPKLILADEPTSALDVISQRVVLEMLSEVRQSLGASMILVGHDMALQAQVADRIGIMYSGRFMEIGPTSTIFNRPSHPYTQHLIASIPSIEKKQNISELANISLSEMEKGSFLSASTDLVEIEPGHYVAA